MAKGTKQSDRLIDPDVAATAVGKFIGGDDDRPRPDHAGAPKQPTGPPPKLNYSIPEFCKAAGISLAFFYELKREGRTPREIHLGTRRLISIEEARRWAAEHTNLSNPNNPQEAA